MKNFLRALHHAWPYRRRLAVSLLAALLAAVFWGGNFTSIYPVLKLLHTGDSLHRWADARVAAAEQDVASWHARAGAAPAEDSLDRRLAAAQLALHRARLLRHYVYLLLPDDCFRALVCVIALALGGIIAKCFFEFVQESLVGSVVNLSVYDLRNRFYASAIRLDVGQFNEQGTTELMARLTHDMESLATAQKMLFGRIVAEPLRIGACVLVACLISWQLTLLFLVLFPVAALLLVQVSRSLRQATRGVLERMSSIYKILQESFQGIRVVKAFTTEVYERRRFREANRDYCQRSQRVVHLEALADPFIEILGVTAVALALLVGSYLVLTQETHLFGLRMTARPLEPEAMLQLYILLAAIADPVRKLSSVFTRLQAGFAAANRVFDYIDRTPGVLPNHDGPRLPRPAWLPAQGQPSVKVGLPALTRARPVYVEFRDVGFSYRPGVPVLTDINLTVRAGETIALVGPNGCGKTTLMTLLLRFQDPDRGSVLVGGLDLRHVQTRSLRQQIGLVTQDTFLFDDTVANNIAYGCRHATREQIVEAAGRAHAHEFIQALPAGYDERVGETGLKLSGGQRQRLALARAILRDPAILILDEFTSQNDSESEADIHRALRDFKEGRTVFVITHKLHTLEIADRIVVLDGGRIVAIGTHPELLASCRTYQRLHVAHHQRLSA